MKIKTLLGVICILLFTMGNSCTSMGGNEMSQNSITGRIAIKGNEPGTWVALVADDGIEYRLKGKLVERLRDKYQQQVVTLTGKLVSKSKGPGLPAGFEVESVIE